MICKYCGKHKVHSFLNKDYCSVACYEGATYRARQEGYRLEWVAKPPEEKATWPATSPYPGRPCKQ
jgi:hypothetical protein